MDTDLQRIIKVVEWLIFKQIADSRRDLADKMGYSESSMSQILNGKVALSAKFIKNLAKMSTEINEDWMLAGKGEMLKKSGPTAADQADTITMPREVWAVIQDQAASLRTRDDQISDVIASIKVKDEQIGKLISLVAGNGAGGDIQPGVARGAVAR
jgi:transcriptional regulator with XRE-family HTH domain